jgi:GT2 family glycosyltransferase
MHPVLILTYNNFELTTKAVQSVYQQSIGRTTAYIVDNGSTDGTAEWAKDVGILMHAEKHNIGVSAGWNLGLNTLFWKHMYDEVLVIGNDTFLPEYFYGTLYNHLDGFVTGISVDEVKSLAAPAKATFTEHPDFSAFLISRQMWEAIGPFNERMPLYCQDCDMHVRAHKMGIKLMQSNTPFYHERSSTLRNARPEEGAVLRAQAETDRRTFKSIWGCIPGDEDYKKLFQ